MSCCVRASRPLLGLLRSASMLPMTVANLKPCPEQALHSTTCSDGGTQCGQGREAGSQQGGVCQCVEGRACGCCSCKSVCASLPACLPGGGGGAGL